MISRVYTSKQFWHKKFCHFVQDKLVNYGTTKLLMGIPHYFLHLTVSQRAVALHPCRHETQPAEHEWS